MNTPRESRNVMEDQRLHDQDHWRHMRTLLIVAVISLTSCVDNRSTAANTSAFSVDGGRATINAEDIASLAELSATEDMRIDGNITDLTLIEWVGIFRDGTIAVLQPADQTVRFFSVSGAPLGAFGRKGGGPGEFERPLAAGWVGDTLWIRDPLLRRITFVSPQRALLRTVPTPSKLLPAGASASDTTVYHTSYPRAVYAGDTLLMSAFNRATQTASLLRTSSTGTIVKSIVDEPNAAPSSVTLDLANGKLSLRAPFMPRLLTDVAPDGRLSALLTTDMKQSTYTLTVIGANGDTAFVRDIGFVGEPVPSDSMEQAVEKALERVTGTAQRMNAKRQVEALVPDHFAPVTRMVVDGLGRTWLGLRPRAGVSRWLLFSGRGRPLGTVSLPGNSRVVAASENAVYAITMDDMDVESVVRYALTIPPKK